MTYASELAAISRTPIDLVKITLDYCTRTFGTTPCLATGTKCYNTRSTCVYNSAYQSTTKDYKFTSHDVPAPWNSGERPYLISVKLLPTEITEVRTLVTRATIEIADEPDSDIGIDPYVTSRASVQGTYWKKWLARNPNFKGRTLTIWEGFDSLVEADFTQKFQGKIETIEFARNKVIIQATDFTADLGDVYWPPKVDVKLSFACASGDTYVHVTDAAQLAAATGYVRIDDEFIKYTTRDTTGHFLTGLTRGMFGSLAANHTTNKKVTRVAYLVEDKITDQLAYMLIDAGVSTTYWDAFDLSGIWANPDFNLPSTEIMISEPTRVSDLLAEIAELGSVFYWVGEDTKMQFVRRLPNYGGRTFASALSDEANIVEGSVRVDLADDKRITRINFWWNHDGVSDRTKRTSFTRGDIVVDAEAEVMFGEPAPRDMYSVIMRHASTYVDSVAHEARVQNMVKRMVWFGVFARAEISLSVELKDATIKTGDYVTISTNQLQDVTGNPWADVPCQVIRRARGRSDNQIDLVLRKLPSRKIGFIAPDASPEWASATAADKQYAFLSNNAPNAGKMDAIGTDGYYIV